MVVRLEHLSKTDIERVLKDNYDLDPRAFVAQARERGLDRLLDNPQNLDMLAAAVASGEWPDSRAGAFELACRSLVTESNEEHSVANAGQPDTTALLDVAGRLFAGQLIAGTLGYALPRPSRSDRGVSVAPPTSPTTQRVRGLCSTPDYSSARPKDASPPHTARSRSSSRPGTWPA